MKRGQPGRHRLDVPVARRQSHVLDQLRDAHAEQVGFLRDDPQIPVAGLAVLGQAVRYRFQVALDRGERRLHVVRHRRQQPRAALGLLLEGSAHGVERSRQRRQLRGAAHFHLEVQVAVGNPAGGALQAGHRTVDPRRDEPGPGGGDHRQRQEDHQPVAQRPTGPAGPRQGGDRPDRNAQQKRAGQRAVPEQGFQHGAGVGLLAGGAQQFTRVHRGTGRKFFVAGEQHPVLGVQHGQSDPLGQVDGLLFAGQEPRQLVAHQAHGQREVALRDVGALAQHGAGARVDGGDQQRRQRDRHHQQQELGAQSHEDSPGVGLNR